MSDNKVTRIIVGGQPTGIIGLQPVLEEVAEELKGRNDDEIKDELLTRLSKKNYISSGTKDAYGQAFLRKYKIFVGEPLEDKDSCRLEIKVLGAGCSHCEKLKQDLMAIMAELNIAADFEHVRDPIEIANYGVIGSPGLIINGDVKAVGSVPPKNKLKEWLLEVINA